MNRLIIGQFYSADSPMHRLDPRVKLLGVLAFITVILFITHFNGYVLAAAYLLSVIKLSKVPFRFFIRGLRAILFILLFASVINLLLTPGETVLFSVGFLRLTTQGIYRAGIMGARLILLVTGSAVLTLTTSPIKLTDGIESLLRPLRLPTHDIALMMTIALRMVPTLAEEMERIMRAQKARGANLSSGGPIKRAKNLLPILVPLFISCFKRADELATAMEARGYRGGKGRSKMHPLYFTKKDFLASGVHLLFCGVLLFSRFV